MSTKFKVPVLIKIKAATQEEADELAHRFMCCAGDLSFYELPELHDAVKWWDLAEVSATIKVRSAK